MIDLLREIAHYVRKHRRYWLIPMIALLVLFGALFILSQTAPLISPFIYVLF